MGVLRTKPGVLFAEIAPGGFHILAALDGCAEAMKRDLAITSACDGQHSGPLDPHYRGEAFDVRTKDMIPAQKKFLIDFTMEILGWEFFYGFLEAEGTPNEHAHFQVKKGTVFS
jgi:hypothetical protein